MILGLTVGQVEPLVLSVLGGRALYENRGLRSDEFVYPRRQNTNSGPGGGLDAVECQNPPGPRGTGF